ncbi:MAG: CpaF family protein [Acidobacteria bacterium]|nr:MAG: CpaF family protein [Acidobacteriota bacterium]
MATLVERSGYQQLKGDYHRRVLDHLHLEQLDRMPREEAEREVVRLVRTLLAQEQAPLSLAERDVLAADLVDEIFGFGPLETLLRDPAISDILVNGADQIYVERGGRLSKSGVTFRDDAHLLRILDRIVSRVGRRIDESSPMVDARLADGSRVNAIIPPLALDGPCVSIRRFGATPLRAEGLLAQQSLTPAMLAVLAACVRGRLNMLISGGTGAGKTTLLNVLSGYIPEWERVITIEDAAELQLKQEHVVRLETRPPNVEGEGAVRQRQLVINSLRMRPDRIVMGECRGEEAVDMLQAMNTGHDGSLTTIHANSPRDALGRLETMASMANLHLPERAIRRQIASALQVVIQLARLSDGTRKILSIAEITGMEGDAICMQELFRFERMGLNERGGVRGRFQGTGLRPQFTERLAAMGEHLKLEALMDGVEVGTESREKPC